MNRALTIALVLILLAPGCDKPEATPTPVKPAAEAAKAGADGAKKDKEAAVTTKGAPDEKAAKAAPAKAAPVAAKAAPAATKAAPTPTKAAPAAPAKAAPAGASAPGLMDPSKATETAPDTFKVVFETTEGSFTVQVHRAWAPIGADRFYNLVKVGFFSNVAFFRVISGFMAQFGIHGDPKVAAAWRSSRIKDDPVDSKVASNTRGKVTFAMAGKNTRTTQFFINFSDQNKRLDSMGFPPIGEVIEGMDVVDKIHSGYGEGAPRGRGPAQNRLQSEGNAYLKAEFPQLDYIKKATLQ